ncbi:MAG TPA: helix-turn-helix domain-containing protein [Gemmatimonadaceae bacterium]|nr:helix-turn-helix domain-containing protein [Gemmatimonadaceae bacterium]
MDTYAEESMATFRPEKIACAHTSCPVERTLAVIGGVWKTILVRELLEGTRRYGQLRRMLPGVTHKVLTQQLRELEVDGVVHRDVYAEVPPRVEYSLTPLGRELAPLLEGMHTWGERLAKAQRSTRDARERVSP